MLKVIILVYMAVLSFFDIQENKIPIIALLIGAAATFAYTMFFLFCTGFVPGDLAKILLGTVPGILLSVMAITTKKAGFADGIVLTLLGMLTDYRRGILVFCLSIVIMALFSTVLLIFHRLEKNSELPYLPFLTIAFFSICLFEH